MKYCFGDIVVVQKDLIGVIVKSWQGNELQGIEPNYDVYVRYTNAITNYPESQVQRYMVRHKYLNDEELQYQENAIKGL
jgi:hypothetical protein